jgi:hypothetical protein
MAEAPAASVEVEPHNPYPGPRPFGPDWEDLFCGRAAEARDLFSLVVAHQAVLLYAQSGAGKTSLLNAGVFPLLREQKFQVLPARVKGPIPDSIPIDEVSNVYVLNVLLSWADKLPAGNVAPQSLVHLSLSQFLQNHGDVNSGQDGRTVRVLVFDQFEELFTFYPDRWKDRRPFFVQLAEALASDPLLRLVIAMREDYLGEMNAHAHMLPEGLETRFRLERLGRDAALAAVVEPPSKGTGRYFSEEAADRLVDDLLKVKVTVDRETTKEIIGDDVEPVQLQVVCQSLWEDLPPDTKEITLEHVRACGDVSEALAGYFERSIEAAARKTGLREGRLRQWFEQSLITPAGTRGTVFREADSTAGIPNAAVDILEDQHVIRCDSRAGAAWYELTHDRFIDPILKSNAQWREARGNANQLRMYLENRAADWERRSRPREGLLNKAELAEANEWIRGSDAAELGCTDTVGSLVEASTAEIEKSRVVRRWRLTAWIAAALVGLATLALLLLTVRQRNNAREEVQVEFAQELIARASINVTSDSQLSLLMALYAASVLRRLNRPLPPMWLESLNQAVQAAG